MVRNAKVGTYISKTEYNKDYQNSDRLQVNESPTEKHTYFQLKGSSITNVKKIKLRLHPIDDSYNGGEIYGSLKM